MRTLPRSVIVGALLLIGGLGTIAVVIVTNRWILAMPALGMMFAGVALITLIDPPADHAAEPQVASPRRDQPPL